MHIDKYKTGDTCMDKPEYRDADGCSYSGAESFLQTKLLGFCGCGDPFVNIKYVGKILRHIHNLKELVWENKITYEEWTRRGKQIGSEEALYFAYYFLDDKGFTEHGGSVPGWLTDAGIEFMEDAEELIEEED